MRKYIFSLVALVCACRVPFVFADCRVVEYTMNDCAACVGALEDVGKLLENGVAIEVFNTDVDEEALARASELGAFKRPTFVVYDDEKEIARYEGKGCAEKILQAIQNATNTKNAPRVKAPAPEPPPVIEPVINDDLTQSADEYSPPPQTDFRTRPRVVDQFRNVGFLDRSRDAWNNRKSDEENLQEPKTDERNNDARLGDRFSGKILDGASVKLDEIKRDALTKLDQIGADTRAALERKVGAEFEATRSAIGAQVQGVEKSVVSAVRLKIDEKIDAFKNKFYMFLFACAAVGVFLLWKKKKE